MDIQQNGRRLNSSIPQSEEMNLSALPNIKQQTGKRNISQIRKDEGEYSRLLSNKNNNRLVQAQQIISDSLKKKNNTGYARYERNNMGKSVQLIL